LAAVLMLTAGSSWLYVHTSQMRTPHAEYRKQPSLSIAEPEWTFFDRHGRLEKKLSARGMEQWPDEESAYLTRPMVEISDQRQQLWQARALHGRIYSDDRRLILDQKVVVRREPAAAGPVVTTDQLWISGEGDLIETDAPVVLRTGSWHFNSEGLRANLGRQHIELLGQVRGIHE
jgi:LPS export ABC transporter protein LptC